MIYQILNLKIKSLLCLALWLFIVTNTGVSQEKLKENAWMKYVNIEEAGYSSARLDSVIKMYEESGAASLFVVSNGRVLLALGDNTRRFMVHSIRKSFLNAMMGIEVEKGKINLEQSLQELEIDDKNPLTDIEKQATVFDLLSARSGIYLPSAYSPQNMIDNLPERGSALPGKNWYYNNWDFNTLVSVYNQQSGKDFFEAFNTELAMPLGMEDFRMTDTYYRYETEKSIHPAYLFRMSARDMARFGQLFLNEGELNGKQLVGKEWINKSTSIISEDLGAFSQRGGYGLLWWVSEIEKGKKMYYASGSGGHRITVIPDDELVIVLRVDTYVNNSVGGEQVYHLFKSILDAKTGEPSSNPTLRVYAPESVKKVNNFHGSMDDYLGVYKHRALGIMEIKKDDKGYFLENGVGIFRLSTIEKDRFYAEDIQQEMHMVKSTEESKRLTIEPVFNAERTLKEVVFYY